MPGGAATELRAAIAARLTEIRNRIAAAGGDPDRITILAVSKGQPLEACRAALEVGLTSFGENRVQEALPKLSGLPEAEWHLIGHLQSNKVRNVVGRFALIQSVDSVRLAAAIAERDSGQAVLMEVNVSGDASKHGFPPEAAIGAAVELDRLLKLRGLMGMGPVAGDPAPAFARLARLRRDSEQRLGRELPVLSMGMSGDLEAAVRAGSTMLRLGRALFGDRSN